MMLLKKIQQQLKGDKTLWTIAALLALFSFMPVYSASSNLAYLYGGGGYTLKYLIKHMVHLILGFLIMYGMHRIPHHYFKGLSILMLPISIILLIVTLAQGDIIDGANASRWIRIPVVGLSFQTSSLASVVLFTYVSRFMSKYQMHPHTFTQTIIPLWLPVMLVCALVLPANLSSAVIIFVMSSILVYLGGYPRRYLLLIFSSGLFGLLFFITTAKAFPDLFPNRVDTWMNRIENFWQQDEISQNSNYQIERAKVAIATGGLIGLGPGKSVQKNFLPQSSSDFIYAIVVEELGIIGALILLSLYVFILVRLLIISHKSDDYFGKLLTLGVGLPIIFQAIINMGVATGLFPVTGQTLPLISSGGTSIWMTCLGLGIIISVSAKSDPSEFTGQNVAVLELFSQDDI